MPPQSCKLTSASTGLPIHGLVGIVGGIGPAASVRLQQLVLEQDRHRCQSLTNSNSVGFLADACYTPYLLYNNPQIPNNNRAALGTGPPSVLALVDTAKALRNAGAKVVAFACTTAYTWQPQVEAEARVPILDLLDRVASKVASHGHVRVGLLDVSGTLATGAFEAALLRHGVGVVIPLPDEQGRVMQTVANLKLGMDANDGPLTELTDVTYRLLERDHSVSAVVLGCTEIATAMESIVHCNNDNGVEYFSTLNVLAEEIVRLGNPLAARRTTTATFMASEHWNRTLLHK